MYFLQLYTLIALQIQSCRRSVQAFSCHPFESLTTRQLGSRDYTAPLFLGTTTTSSANTASSATTTTTISEYAKRRVEKPVVTDNVILYDGICNFCNTWVDILLRLDRQAKFRFAPLQSSIGQELLVQIGKDADDISSVVLVKQDGRFFDKSACVLQVLEEVGPRPLTQPLANMARTLIQRDIRDGLYDRVAENRYNLMGKREECRCSDPRFADRFLL
ncbi:hypothetical protein ACA910_000071 [Epithemia clementina (nom. ined.)]